MPYVQIDISRPLSQRQLAQLRAGAVEIMGKILRKKPELTAVSIRSVSGEQWSIAGEDSGPTGFVRAHVTEGTNSAEEIEQAIGAFHGLLAELVEGYEVVSYVVIDEVPAGNWGFGGVSQGGRKRAVA